MLVGTLFIDVYSTTANMTQSVLSFVDLEGSEARLQTPTYLVDTEICKEMLL